MADNVVYVIDDDELVRSSISALLGTLGLSVLEFESAESFLDWLPPSPRGVVVTDLRMLGMSGLDLVDALIARKSHLPVIVVTAHADVPLTVRLMQSGVVTVLEKPYSSEDLDVAVRNALKLEQASAPVAMRTREAERRLRTLSDGEFDVLCLVRDGRLNKEIAGELQVSMRTVENRRSSVLKKMQVSSVPELIRVLALTDEFAERR